MSMLENLRERSEEERIAFAALAAGFVALLLFLLWGATFFTGGASRDAIAAQSASALSAVEAAAQLQAVVKDFNGQYAQLRSVLESAQFNTEEVGVPVVDISVDNSGDIQVQNVIVGPVRND